MIARLADQSWPDLAGRRPLVVLPLGSCEQHGPHLPLDTDLAVAQDVTERAAALLAEDISLLVAPGQPYGASGEHEGFPGTVSIGHEALSLLIVEIGRSMLRWAGRLLVVNGHGGNLPSMAGAVVKLRSEGRDTAWWPCLPAGSDLHAGHAETSMMLALRAGAVHAERAAAGPCEPIEQLLDRLTAESVRGVSEYGVLGDPAGASAELGEQLLAGMSARLAADIRAWRVSEQGRLGCRLSAPGPATAGVRA
jgi:mycofactocin system creatininase family protein